jgi:hypothetical protein
MQSLQFRIRRWRANHKALHANAARRRSYTGRHIAEPATQTATNTTAAGTLVNGLSVTKLSSPPLWTSALSSDLSLREARSG